MDLPALAHVHSPVLTTLFSSPMHRECNSMFLPWQPRQLVSVVRGWHYHENTEQVGGYSALTCVVWWRTDTLIIAIMCVDIITTCQTMSIFLCVRFLHCEMYYISNLARSTIMSLHHTLPLVLASDPQSSMLTQRKTSAPWGGKKEHQQPYPISLFLHTCSYLSVCPSVCLHNSTGRIY